MRQNIRQVTHNLLLEASFDAEAFESKQSYEALKARRRVKTLRRIMRAFQRNVKGKP